MPYVRFEPTFPASQRAKTVHVLDSAATVTGSLRYYRSEVETNGETGLKSKWDGKECERKMERQING
jgi:hypothetical protein